MIASLASSWSWYLALLLLSVALVVAITMAHRVWQEMHEDEEPATEAELVAEFERAHAAGELDDAEIQRVRALLERPERSELPRGVPSRLEHEPAAPEDDPAFPGVGQEPTPQGPV